MLKILLEKKGVSAVVATILLIALTMAIVAILWVVVNNLVNDELSGAESCFGVFEKVTLDSRYTCYNNSDGANEIIFAVSIGELDGLEEILVGISKTGASLSFEINESPSSLPGLTYFDRTSPVTIPGKNSGITYIYQLPASFTSSPDTIEISPTVNGESCESSSSITQIDNCALLS
jgi:hypothetical protein